jgi:hypothetical protein
MEAKSSLPLLSPANAHRCLIPYPQGLAPKPTCHFSSVIHNFLRQLTFVSSSGCYCAAACTVGLRLFAVQI